MAESVSAAAFAVIPATPEAWPFLLSTWVRSYRDSDFARPISRGVYHAMHHAIAERILARAQSWLITPADEPDLYLGWMVCEPALLHYVYVKPTFRQRGLGNQLMAQLEPPPPSALPRLNFTHNTDAFEWLRRPHMVYNPYLL